MASEPISPRGRLFLGSFVSSAAVTTASNPVKAKNMIAAPEKTPSHPAGGIKGVQFTGLMEKRPSTIKRMMTPILIATMTALVRALFFVPGLRAVRGTAQSPWPAG